MYVQGTEGEGTVHWEACGRNFHLVKNKILAEKTFTDCLLTGAAKCAARGHHAPKFSGENICE